MAYPTLETLVGASSVQALTSLGDDEAAKLRNLAIYAAESFCAQKFGLEEGVSIAVDGSGKRALALPRRLATLDTLVVSASALTASDVSLSENHDALYVNNDAGFNWYERAIRDDQPPLFASGIRSVTVTGDWGFTDDEIADDDPSTRLAMALRTDMEEQALALTGGLSESSRAFVKLRVTNLNEGPLSVNINQTAIGLSPDVMMLLEPYVWRPLGVLV